MQRMLVALGVLGLVCAAQAQDGERPPELKTLDKFVGEWTFEERGKDPETGEKWTTKGTGEYRQLGDLFHVWRGETKDGSFVAIDAYDPLTKGIVRRGFGSGGWQGTGTLKFDDETMALDLSGVTAKGEKTRRRCKGTLEIPTSTYTCEDLIDGKWVPALKGTQTKVK